MSVLSTEKIENKVRHYKQQLMTQFYEEIKDVMNDIFEDMKNQAELEKETYAFDTSNLTVDVVHIIRRILSDLCYSIEFVKNENDNIVQMIIDWQNSICDIFNLNDYEREIKSYFPPAWLFKSYRPSVFNYEVENYVHEIAHNINHSKELNKNTCVRRFELGLITKHTRYKDILDEVVKIFKNKGYDARYELDYKPKNVYVIFYIAWNQ